MGERLGRIEEVVGSSPICSMFRFDTGGAEPRGVLIFMTPLTAILIASGITAAASLLGGLVPMLVGLSHRRMQVLLSVVAGAMAGIATLDLLPHAVEAMASSAASAVETGGHHHDHDHADIWPLQMALLWVIGGFLAMYLLERFVCFHHHESGEATCGHAGHGHAVSLSGAFTGLSVHAILAGMGLGAAVLLESSQGVAWPGMALLVAIVLHKPFDGLAIVSLMGRDRRSASTLLMGNVIYALVTPAGIFIAWWWAGGQASPMWAGPAVAVTAGILLCIALCDLLPELQSHDHDRLLLTVALLAGLLLAGAASFMH